MNTQTTEDTSQTVAEDTVSTPADTTPVAPRKRPGRPITKDTNAYKTRELYATMLAEGKTRKETVKAFIDKLGLSAPMASTYFQQAQTKAREALANSGASV